MFRVEEINSIDELAGLRLTWQWLLGQTREATFFQSLDWLEVYWKYFGEGQRLRALVCYSDDQLVGIMPLVVRTERTLIGKLRTLTYPLDDWGSFYGPIGPQPTATLFAGLRHVRQTRRDWDVLDLRWVNPRVDWDRTPRTLRTAGFQSHPQACVQVALIDARGGWDEYWASRTSRWRSNVHRSEKKMAADGDLAYEHYRPAGISQGEFDPRWDLYDACEHVASRSWQATADGTTLSDPLVRDFLRDVHRAAVRAGAADMHLLRLNGQPLAFAYNYVVNGYVSGLRAGYDASASCDGAGNVLLRRAIETSFRQGDHTYDLGADIDAQRPWATSIVRSVRYSHFPPAAPRTQAIRLKRALQRWMAGRPNVTTA